MDVDENSSAQDGDFDTNFLTQFAQIQTRDKEELINQFQYIGNEPSSTTARFFLDMNNWNLQAAVGCYFDYLATTKLPSMKILHQCTIGDGEAVTPQTAFKQSWQVQNDGEVDWPEGTCLREIILSGDASVPVSALAPFDSTTITIPLISPAELGEFCTKWRLCTPAGTFFGPTITCKVQVSETGTLALTQQLSSLHTTSTTTGEVAAGVGGGAGPLLAIGPAPPPPDEEMWDN